MIYQNHPQNCFNQLIGFVQSVNLDYMYHFGLCDLSEVLRNLAECYNVTTFANPRWGNAEEKALATQMETLNTSCKTSF